MTTSTHHYEYYNFHLLQQMLQMRLSVCPSLTLVHLAKAAGQNEMPLGRDTHMVPSNTALDRDGPPWEEEIWGSEPPVKICIANYCQSIANCCQSGMVTTDILQELSNALSNGTVTDPIRLPVPQITFAVMPTNASGPCSVTNCSAVTQG